MRNYRWWGRFVTSGLKHEWDSTTTVASIFSGQLFGWLVADGWCWFVLREEYCWLVAGSWFVLREKYCWLVADKPSEQAECLSTLC
jgi:hypothetical protein